MVHLQEIESQLKRIGANFRFWGRSSVRELQHILVPNEQIQGCLNGRYEGGFAVLCATDMRLLLIDKKPLYLTLEDIRYDMIVEVDYNHQFIDATIQVFTPNKNLRFSAFKQKELRDMTMYIQRRVMELRQQHMMHELSPEQFTESEPQSQTLAPVLTSQAFATQANAAVGLTEPEVAMGRSRLPSISMPRAVNPYITAPFILRRRIGRFHKRD